MSSAPRSFTHRFVPGQGDAAGTTLLLLHGTGGTETDLLGLGASLLPGASLLSPRGRMLENGMPRFFRRLAEGVFDLDDLKLRTHELADFVREACEAFSLDPGRIVAVGYSNGANIAGAILLLRPETLAAAALFRPMVPLVPESLPDLSGRAVLVASGQNDPIVPIQESRRLVELLASAGASVDTHWHPGGHELGGDDLEAARRWLRALPVAHA